MTNRQAELGRRQRGRIVPAVLGLILGSTGCATLGGIYQQGEIFYSQGRWDEAIAAYYSALQEDPGRGELYASLARALQARNLPDEALASWEKAHALSPGDERWTRSLAEAYFQRGLRSRQAGRISDAFEAWEKAVALQPEATGAAGELAKLYSDPGPGAATEDADSHRIRGLAYYRQGQLEKAVEEFRRVLQSAPRDGKTFNNLGSAYLKLGQLQEAESAFEQAVRLAPDLATAFLNWGTVFYQQGRYQRAREMWEKVLTLEPQNESAVQNLDRLSNLGY